MTFQPIQKRSFGRRKVPPVAPRAATKPAATDRTDLAEAIGSSREPALNFVEGWENKPDIERALPVGIGIAEFIKRELNQDGFVRGETACMALGALAGLACQIAAKEVGETDPNEIQLQSPDGYLVTLNGTAKNMLLFHETASFWGWVRSSHARIAPVQIPDPRKIMQTIISIDEMRSLNRASPAMHAGNEYTAFDFAVKLWPHLLVSLEKYLPERMLWSLAMGGAYRQILQGISQLDMVAKAPTISLDSAVRTLITDPSSM